MGAGAVGGFIAATLARAGHEVSVVARGAHLAAIRQDGLRLTSEAGLPEFTVRVNATDDPSHLGPQDVVFLTLKAHDVPGIAHRLQGAVEGETIVVPALNGLPWWYFDGRPSSPRTAPIACLDPDGAAARHIRPECIIGCVVRIAAEVSAPGVVRHTFGRRFVLGEPSDRSTVRLRALCETMQAAGLDAQATTRIRDEIWAKLAGNLATNPLAALSLSRLDELCADPALVLLMRQLVIECRAVGARYGIEFDLDIEGGIERVRTLGRAKPSMLQDLERGRPMEIPAIIEAVAELARRVDVETPYLDTILALISERAKHLRQ